MSIAYKQGLNIVPQLLSSTHLLTSFIRLHTSLTVLQ